MTDQSGNFCFNCLGDGAYDITAESKDLSLGSVWGIQANSTGLKIVVERDDDEDEDDDEDD